MKLWIKAVALAAVTALAACGGGPTRRVVTDISIGSGQSVQGSFTGGAVPLLGDTAPHVWNSGHPYNLPVHGVDVSRYQGDVNWHQARASGINFAFIKATEGGDHSDPAFRRYWAETRAAGIPRGAYHFYYFCRSGAEQAAWFMANVPRERGALPPVIDLEWNHQSRSCPFKPSAAEVRREVGIMMSMLHQYYGQRPIIYTTVDFYRDTGVRNVGAEFWLRSVADHPRGTYPGQQWSFWQYTGTGTAPGFRGNVDLNAFAGSRAQWNRWLATRSQR